jgi:hypothetical protein
MTQVKLIRLAVLALYDKGQPITAHHLAAQEPGIPINYISVYLNQMMKTGEIRLAGVEQSSYGGRPLNVYNLVNEDLLLEKVRNGR